MNIRTAFLNPFIDPVRRKHVLARILEGMCGGLMGVGAFCLIRAGYPWYWALAVGVVVAPLAEYAIFEFVLEPLTKWTGNYWERGPRDDEKFKIG